MYNEAPNNHDAARSRTKLAKEALVKASDYPLFQDHDGDVQQLKLENTKLRKTIKEAQAKRTHAIKECSQLQKQVERLQIDNRNLREQVKDEQGRCEDEKYRWEELKFLNKQLSNELQQLRAENQSLLQKVRYSTEVLEQKYEQLEEKSIKRMQQSAKRITKAIHYLQTLTPKQIDKTRDILVDNLRKGVQLLRGKHGQELSCEGQIEELMSPIKALQQQISVLTRELNSYKHQNTRILQENVKYKSMEKEQIPLFKEAVEKLKKSLAQVRSQLSQNEYEKLQVKKKYEEKLRQSDHKYSQLFKECRKIKLQKKICENRLAELEAQVEEEKERLIGENQMLKKLCQNQSQDSNSDSRVSQSRLPQYDTKTHQKFLKKNYSSNQLKTNPLRNSSMLKSSPSDYQISEKGAEADQYYEQKSQLQEQLKQQICRIDQQIEQIRKNLAKEMEVFHH